MAKINDNKEILSLLEKPLWQMTGKEFCMLNQYVISITTGLGSANQSPVHVTGVHALAEYLQCSDSTIHVLKRHGVLDAAIVSKVGKRIVFDAEKARELATGYKQS